MKLSEKRALEKRQQILLSAINIVNERGYEKATMEEIAAELLMTKGSLYYYFKNRGDLLYQCHNLVFDQALKDIERLVDSNDSTLEIMKRMIAVHIDYAIEKKETFNMLIDPSKIFNKDQLKNVLFLRKKYSSYFDKVIERGIIAGEINVNQPMITKMIILGANNWIQQWYKPDGSMTKKEIKRYFIETIIKILK